MSIHARRNLYHGVNAHLHSLFQANEAGAPSTWPGFHHNFITYLADALNAQLPDHYRAIAEQSLQVLVGLEPPSRRRPDVSVYQQGAGALVLATATVQATWQAQIVLEEPPDVLAGPDVVQLDYDAVYQETFRRGRWGQEVDYAAMPLDFETYAPVDQAAIQARMAAIAEAVQRGDDLEAD